MVADQGSSRWWWKNLSRRSTSLLYQSSSFRTILRSVAVSVQEHATVNLSLKIVGNQNPQPLFRHLPLSFPKTNRARLLAFTATDPEAGILTYHFVNGENNNSLFALDSNVPSSPPRPSITNFNSSAYNIQVEVRDVLNGSIDKTFPFPR